MNPKRVTDPMAHESATARRAAIVLELTFLAGILIADLVPGQPPTGSTLSDLVLGPMPWLVVTAFLLHAGSLGLLSLTQPPLAKIALIAAAVGMVLAAAFWVGQGPVVDGVHVFGAWLAFGGVALAAAFVLIGAAPAVRVLSAAVVVGTMALAFSGDWFPLLERVQVLLNAAWLILVAWPQAH